MDTLGCNWDPAVFLIFSHNVFDSLIYYSHLGPLIFSLLLGIVALVNNPRALVNRVLFCITVCFSIWVYFDLILWASEKPEYIMFFWSAQAPVELLIYAAAWYLVAIFANGGKKPPLREMVIAAVPFIPIFLFAHTSYNLLGFDYTNCDRGAVEGPLWQYIYVVELLFILWIAHKTFGAFRGIRDRNERLQLLSVGIGTILFLTTFTAGNITLIFSLDWSYEQYKLIGMPIFAAFITYSALKFKTFNLKVITAQALVVAVAILVFSMLFLTSIQNVRIVSGLTFILVAILGYLLIRNVRKEIQQRELIEVQEKELEVANERQENLLHFISHEIKGYLTKGEGAFAEIVEDDSAAIPAQIKTLARGALVEMRKGVATVMDILDASNLKKGTVAFKNLSFDFKSLVIKTVEEQRPMAYERHLGLDVKIAEGAYAMQGDEEKIHEHVIRNLIDNAIRYTPSGTVHVELSDGDGKIRFMVADSGVGITPEDMARLFTEGGHGKDSIKVNVHSTGYGLFIAKQIVVAHGGKIWAESDGQGKGARFIVEFIV